MRNSDASRMDTEQPIQNADVLLAKIRDSLLDRLQQLQIGDFLKIVTGASFVLGLLVLWGFTSSAHIIFQISDLASVVTLGAIALFFLFALILCSLLPLLPVLMVTLPELQLPEKPGEGRIKLTYLASYLKAFGVTIASTFILPTFWLLGSILWGPSILLGPGWMLAGLGASALFWICVEYFRGRLAVSPVGYYILTTVWVLVVALSSGVILARLKMLPSDASVLWFYLLIAAANGWQFFVVLAVMRGFAMVLGLAVAVAFVLILLTPVAGATFRIMGLGGGIPITVLAKLYNQGAGPPEIVRLHGCLVLWVGNQITIQAPQSSAQYITRCHMNPRTPVFEEDKYVPTILHTITRDSLLDVYSSGNSG